MSSRKHSCQCDHIFQMIEVVSLESIGAVVDEATVGGPIRVAVLLEVVLRMKQLRWGGPIRGCQCCGGARLQNHLNTFWLCSDNCVTTKTLAIAQHHKNNSHGPSPHSRKYPWVHIFISQRCTSCWCNLSYLLAIGPCWWPVMDMIYLTLLVALRIFSGSCIGRKTVVGSQWGSCIFPSQHPNICKHTRIYMYETCICT